LAGHFPVTLEVAHNGTNTGLYLLVELKAQNPEPNWLWYPFLQSHIFCVVGKAHSKAYYNSLDLNNTGTKQWVPQLIIKLLSNISWQNSNGIKHNTTNPASLLLTHVFALNLTSVFQYLLLSKHLFTRSFNLRIACYTTVEKEQWLDSVANVSWHLTPDIKLINEHHNEQPMTPPNVDFATGSFLLALRLFRNIH
jgi:hypothetical protein